MRSDTSKLAVRAFLAVVVIAVISAVGEFIFVVVMNGVGTGVRFTGTYFVVVFAALCGIIPSWPTPSRVSESPLNRTQRVLILVEVTAIVIAVITTFTALNGEDVRDIAMASAFCYLFILFIFAAWQWKALRGE